MEKALYHFKTSGVSDESKDIVLAQSLDKILISCTEARNLKEWKTVMKEANSVICLGADSAPQVRPFHLHLLVKFS